MKTVYEIGVVSAMQELVSFTGLLLTRIKHFVPKDFYDSKGASITPLQVSEKAFRWKICFAELLFKSNVISWIEKNHKGQQTSRAHHECDISGMKGIIRSFTKG